MGVVRMNWWVVSHWLTNWHAARIIEHVWVNWSGSGSSIGVDFVLAEIAQVITDAHIDIVWWVGSSVDTSVETGNLSRNLLQSFLTKTSTVIFIFSVLNKSNYIPARLISMRVNDVGIIQLAHFCEIFIADPDNNYTHREMTGFYL